jgi:hypothetical protein
MPAITPEPIMKVAMGFMASKHLFAASEIGLYCQPERQAYKSFPAGSEFRLGHSAL